MVNDKAPPLNLPEAELFVLLPKITCKRQGIEQDETLIEQQTLHIITGYYVFSSLLPYCLVHVMTSYHKSSPQFYLVQCMLSSAVMSIPPFYPVECMLSPAVMSLPHFYLV